MADKKISALTSAATPLNGTEVLPVVQGGSTVKVSVANLTAGRSISASNLQVQTNTGLEMVLVNQTDASGGTLARVRLSHGSGSSGVFDVGAGYGVIGLATSGPFVFTTNSAERMRIEDSGNLTIANGNVVISTAGKGIDFSANGGDVLSQYDEGTYTPVFTASSSNPTVTYGLQRGKYVRVGNSVTVSVFISWSALSGGSGDLQISLPFAGESSVGAGAAGAIADLTGFTFAAGRTFCSVRPNSNVLYATFPQSGSAVSTSNTTVAQTASSGLIVFSTTYLI